MTVPTWETALDALENYLLEVEALLAGETDAAPPAWVKPPDLGPLPVHLVDRALDLQRRNSELLAALPDAIAGKRQQHRAVEHLQQSSGRHASPATYVDVSA